MATKPLPAPHEREPGLGTNINNVILFPAPTTSTNAPDPTTREGYIAFLQEIGEQPLEEALKIADVLHPKEKGEKAVGAIATSGAHKNKSNKQSSKRGSDWTDIKAQIMRIGIENGIYK